MSGVYEEETNLPEGLSKCREKGMAEIINCAHRGASALAPENTLAALRLAVKLGATMAEIDLQQTADDELVVFHDDNLSRTSNGTGPLWGKSLQQLRRLDVGSWFSNEFQDETIPTLEKVVQALDGQLELNLELKLHGHERDLEALLANKIEALGCARWCLVTSFDQGVIDRLLDLAPGLKVGYIVEKGGWQGDLLESRVSVLSLEKSLITADRVRRAHAAGKEIHAWTVNKEAEMEKLRTAGVDVLISNHPDLVAEFLGKGRI
jgi:glycerophosphoryl diester phosphodiesterase